MLIFWRVKMFENQQFILSSIKNILQEAVAVSRFNCNGIESFPLQDYVLQSTFLKMTGYSEQKLKCICWDIASADYEFRYQVYQHWDFGECSNLNDKTKIYKKLVETIKKYDGTFSANAYIKNLKGGTNLIISESFEECKNILDNSSLRFFCERDFHNFSTDTDTFKVDQIICKYSRNKTFIFDDTLKNIYENLYRQRNRCAHNLKSYQQNLPRITELLKKTRTDNYFYYFTVLIILDKIFIALYKKLADLIKKNNW